MKKYYIGGLLTLITIAFATVTLAVNKDVIGYRRYIYTPPTKAGSIVFVAFCDIHSCFVSRCFGLCDLQTFS